MGVLFAFIAGMLITLVIMALLRQGRTDEDTERLDALQMQGASLMCSMGGDGWGVMRNKMLIGTGSTAREAIDSIAKGPTP